MKKKNRGKELVLKIEIMRKEIAIPQEVILSKIYIIRGQKVMLDRDPPKADKFSGTI